MPPKGPKSKAPAPVPFTLLPGHGLLDDEVELGSVSGVFGVRGEVRLFLHNPDSELLRKPRKVALIAPDGKRYQVTVSSRSGAGKRILGHFAEVAERELAASLKGWSLALAKSELPALDDDEFYVWQLEGAEVFVADEEAGDRKVGTVMHVHNTPGGDLLEIEGPGELHAFVPCVEEFVVELDLEEGRVVVTAESLEEE